MPVRKPWAAGRSDGCGSATATTPATSCEMTSCARYPALQPTIHAAAPSATNSQAKSRVSSRCVAPRQRITA